MKASSTLRLVSQRQIFRLKSEKSSPFTEQRQEKVKEKWTHIMVEIDKNLKRDNYSAALQFVDKFLTDCESRELSLQALMKRAQSCLDAWQDTRKFLSTLFPSFFSLPFFFSSLHNRTMRQLIAYRGKQHRVCYCRL